MELRVIERQKFQPIFQIGPGGCPWHRGDQIGIADDFQRRAYRIRFADDVHCPYPRGDHRGLGLLAKQAAA